MKALVIDGPDSVSMQELPKPSIPLGECLVAVHLTGICRTDLELAKGYMGFKGIPGHEFVGVVMEAPPGHEQLVGRRVVGEINAAASSEHAQQDVRHAPNRTVLGILNRPGSFAEFLCLPPANLLCAPDSVDDEEAVFAEPLAAALEVLEQLHIPPGERILVVGDGKLGLLVTQVLQLHGARVTLWGHHDRKLSLARRWNVTATQTSNGVPELAPKDRYRLVVEASGSPGGFHHALAAVQPRGTVVLKSTYAPTNLPELDAAKIVVDEITLVGSRCGRLAPALRLLDQGKIDVKCLIDHHMELAQGVDAFPLAARRGALKVLLRVATG